MFFVQNKFGLSCMFFVFFSFFSSRDLNKDLSPSILTKRPSYSCRFLLLCRIISIACLFSSFHKALWGVSHFCFACLCVIRLFILGSAFKNTWAVVYFKSKFVLLSAVIFVSLHFWSFLRIIMGHDFFFFIVLRVTVKERVVCGHAALPLTLVGFVFSSVSIVLKDFILRMMLWGAYLYLIYIFGQILRFVHPASLPVGSCSLTRHCSVTPGELPAQRQARRLIWPKRNKFLNEPLPGT